MSKRNDLRTERLVQKGIAVALKHGMESAITFLRSSGVDQSVIERVLIQNLRRVGDDERSIDLVELLSDFHEGADDDDFYEGGVVDAPNT